MLGTIKEPVEVEEQAEVVVKEEVKMVEAEAAVERTGAGKKTKLTPPKLRPRTPSPEPRQSLRQNKEERS